MSHLREIQKKCTIAYGDNSSSIKLSKNPIMLARCKHINVRYHFFRNLTKQGVIEMVHCSSQNHITDIMTMSLKLETFCKIREKLGIVDVSGLD